MKRWLMIFLAVAWCSSLHAATNFAKPLILRGPKNTNGPVLPHWMTPLTNSSVARVPEPAPGPDLGSPNISIGQPVLGLGAPNTGIGQPHGGIAPSTPFIGPPNVSLGPPNTAP